jgi:hypothetical protein
MVADHMRFYDSASILRDWPARAIDDHDRHAVFMHRKQPSR